MWTEEDIQKLKSIYKTHTEAQLSEIFGVSRDAIKYQLDKQGFTKNRIPPHARPLSEVREIFKYSEEHGIRKAASKFSLSTFVIKNIRARFKRMLDKRVEEIKPEAVKKLRGSAMAHAINRGQGAHAEDYASFCCLALVEGKFSKHDWMFVDFLKQTFGNTTTKVGEAKVRAESFHEDLEDVEVSAETQTRWTEVIEGIELRWDERILFLLIYQWGFTYQECGTLFGITESAISIRMTLIHDLLKGIELEKQERVVKVVRKNE